MPNELIAPSQRSRAALVRLAAVTVAVLLISLLVLNNSRAAFTATTEASGDWTAATVELSNDTEPVGVLFDVDDLLPGHEASAEVTVEYKGTAEAVDVSLYGEEIGGALADHLDLTVEVDGIEVFSGSLADFDGTDFDDSAHAWEATTEGTERTYDFTVTLVDGEDVNAAQGQDASINFLWEARSQ